MNNNLEAEDESLEPYEYGPRSNYGAGYKELVEERAKARARLSEDMGEAAKEAKEAWKNVTQGTAGGEKSIFILGYVSGYLKAKNKYTH